NNAFLAGDDISFADIMFGHVLYRYYTLDFDRLPLKNLQDYYDRLIQRPSYQENVMVDYSALKVD
ncbi:MAG: glutathione binding-like protein, partial [Pseudomonadota bacterium]